MASVCCVFVCVYIVALTCAAALEFGPVAIGLGIYIWQILMVMI